MEASQRFGWTWVRASFQKSGWLAILGAVALLSPGVDWVRAEPDASNAREIADGPSCQAGSADVPSDLEHLIEQVRIQAAAHPQSPDDEVVYLNNRGFNYAPAPIPDPARFDGIR